MVSMDSTEGLSPSVCATHLRPRPQYLDAGVAEGAWRLVQDRLQPLQLGSAKDRCCTPRARGDGHEASRTLGIEGANTVPHRLHRAAQALGDLPRPASLGALKHDLRAPYGERVRGTQARLKPGALLSTRLADEDGWMHAQQMRSSIRSHKRSDEDALGRVPGRGVGTPVLGGPEGMERLHDRPHSGRAEVLT